LIIADIEGSSGCWSYRASSFMTKDWARACLEMTRDVQAVVQPLGLWAYNLWGRIGLAWVRRTVSG